MLLVFVALGFAAGSIPTGVIVGRRRGIDIRRQGSGNIGATNVTRVLGLGPGLFVLALDAAKGLLPVLAARAWCGEPSIVAFTGFAAILGHCFSPWLGGKGGKGVATALGVFTATVPALALVGLAVFLVIGGRTKVPALGSLAGCAAATLFAFATDAMPAFRYLALATTILLIYTHRGNLIRLVTSSS